jgi:hypothetical protein
MLVFWLFLAFLMLLCRFLVRTRAERDRILQREAKLNRAVERMEAVRRRIADLLRHFGGALIAERLRIWEGAMTAAGAVPESADTAKLESIADKLPLFRAITHRIETVLAELEERRLEMGLDEGIARPDPADAAWEAEARRLLDLLKRMDAVSGSFETRRLALEQAIAETRDALRDARSFFSDDGQQGAEDLHIRLDEINRSLKQMLGERKEVRSAFWLDRMVFSVYVPVLVSLLLVAMSADGILGGAAGTLSLFAGAF